MSRYFESNGWRCRVNSDLSGEATVRAPNGGEYTIPGELIIEVTAETLRAELIAKIEQLDTADVMYVAVRVSEFLP